MKGILEIFLKFLKMHQAEKLIKKVKLPFQIIQIVLLSKEATRAIMLKQFGLHYFTSQKPSGLS